MRKENKVTLEDVKRELAHKVEEARNFMTSEFSEEWEEAERYFAGECDLEISEGRSTIVKTVTRDVVRAIMPSVMRVLLQTAKPVEYWPNNIQNAAYVDQQGLWVNQCFLRNDGYMQLYSAIMEGFKLKGGPIKAYWEDSPAPTYFTVTGIAGSAVMEYMELPDCDVEDVREKDSPKEGSEQLYDIDVVQYHTGGKLIIEAVPMYEFFFERNGTDIRNCLHGHAREMTVGEAIEMGLESDDWDAMTGSDPETTNFAGASRAKRGYSKDMDNKASVDPMNKMVLISEAYCQYDLNGDGLLEKYVFYLGGNNYAYLHHEKIEDFCMSVVVPDPVPFSVIGNSLPRLTKSHQDTQTSLLRAMIDNAHIANNPRAAGDPTKIDFNDLMNNAIGAPIKTRGDSAIQLFDVPFTAANLLPVLQHLNIDVEERTGITKAAQGLDPDALQSTDKQAVMNTIQLSQGQVELYVRNIVQTGLIPLFASALRLSMRHENGLQMLRFKGAVIPINIQLFDADLLAVPNVGLGTASPQMKLQTLNFIYGQQKEYMAQFGLDNPFTSLSQVYNTLEDMVEIGGIPNVGRYFNYVGKTEEQIIAKGLAEAAAAQAAEAAKNAPIDPSKAMMMIESGKRRIEVFKEQIAKETKELELQYKAIDSAAKNDLERDKLAQDRVINFANKKLDQASASAALKKEQDTNGKPTEKPTIDKPVSAPQTDIAAE
jgi:hypothetical protein